MAAGSASGQNQASLVELADRYCIEPDGDHRLTWSRAQRDGFSELTSADFPGLRLPGGAGRNLRGYRRMVDNVEFRVLTSANTLIAAGDGRAHFRRCWVSTSDDDIGRVNRDLGRLLGIDSFRVEKTRIFAWVPQADGSRRSVARRIYLAQSLTLAREQGMRDLSSRRYGKSVFIGYASPRDEETYQDFDWTGPDPINAPQ